jgi:hypothetical protein
MDLRTLDLERLNSLTKYPSIPTYHALDPKNGSLLETPIEFTGPLLATEKIDGTNARIVALADGSYLLGSREEFLYARGDLIGNPAMGIVAALRDIAERLAALRLPGVTVWFGEFYGGKVTGASKQYTAQQQTGYRLFDVVRLEECEPLLARSQAELSAWRESGGQPFVAEGQLTQLAAQGGLDLTPRVAEFTAEDLPHDVAGVHAFLQRTLDRTRAALDADAGGRPEGLVVRALDRSRIAKLRFEDYERTLRRRK